MQKQQVTQHEYFTKYICPANPIITKSIEINEQAKVAIKNNQSSLTNSPLQNENTKKKNFDPEEDSVQEDQLTYRLTLMNNYNNKLLVYKKFDNKQYWERNKRKYFASIFTNLVDWPENKIHSIQCNGLKFSSQAQSMNLFAVYQTGHNQFDLILQNDINTCGYTQWYYFAVSNKQKFQTIKFNIVNLYKSKSLYSSGMKPLVFSKKTGKGWQRGGTNIIYADNQMNVEYSHRLYRTLSFQYTFLHQNNQTLFAHCYPYTYTTLKQKLTTIQKNPRVKLRQIGTTCMKKNIPIVQFSQQDSNTNKKSIIIMARQHPGQTVGSLVMDQILCQLSRPTTENEFLLWKFNIYCIPMVNIDGVILGNYRGNAYGYDLNRCWDKQNVNKLPELVYIKKQIRRINKKYPVELILDLHGHSRKMGSFFYGNPFGKNTCLYAFVASNMSPNISFEDSTFCKERTEKVTSARIILGNMIKDTGCFYTYETSFYGSQVNNKKIHFNQQNFQQLGKILIISAYKTFIQLHKQQKSLKQSLYLRQARKQISGIQQINFGQVPDSGSDSEAQLVTLKQLNIKNAQQQKSSPFKKARNINNKNEQENIERISVEIQVGQSAINGAGQQYKGQQFLIHMDVQHSVKRQSSKKTNKNIRIQSMSQKYSLFVGFQKSQQLTNKKSNYQDNLTRKNYLLQKLRVFGQTFIQPTLKQANKQTQTGSYLNIQSLSKKTTPILKQQQIIKSPQYRRRKNRNKSLIIRMDNLQKIGMADIVKINKLQYKRIQRNSVIENSRRDLKPKNVLPNIS